MAIRVLVADNDADTRRELREMVSESGFEVAGIARDGQETIQLAVQLGPHVALVSQDLPGVSGLMTCEMLSAVVPDVMPILLADVQTPDLIEGALRSGVRAVLSRPFNAIQLAQKIEELADVRSKRDSEEFAQLRDPSRIPSIVAVTGARGGVGKSTIAANLAVVLAKQAPEQVLLFDLYTQFGDLATMFNVTPKSALVDVIPASDDLDADLIQSIITKHSSGLHLLVTSLDPMPLDLLTEELMDNLLYLLKRKYRYVVIDVPPMLHHTTLNVVARSTIVLLVASLLDLTTVADTRKFLDAVKREQIANESIGVILNRVSRDNKLHTADVENLFERSVVAHIPNDLRLLDASNHGMPLALHDGDSPFMRSIAGLSRRVSGVPDADDTPSDVPVKKTWLRLRK